MMLSLIEVQILLDICAVGCVLPLISFIGQDLGASAYYLGIIEACYGVAQLFGSVFMGRVADVYGAKTVLCMNYIAASLGYVIMCNANSLYIMALSRVLVGFFKQQLLASRAYISSTSSSKDRNAAIGRVSMCVGIGYTIGPFLGAMITRHFSHDNDYKTHAFASCMFYAIAFIIVYIYLPNSKTIKTTSSSSPSSNSFANRISAVITEPVLVKLYIAGFFFDFGYLSFRGTFALFLREHFNVDAYGHQLIMAYIGILTIFSQGIVVQFVSKYFSERFLVRHCVWLLAIAYALFVFLPPSLYMLVLLLLPFDVAGSVGKTSLIALITKQQSPEHNIGLLMGVLSSVSSICRIASPWLGGLLFSSNVTYPSMFACITCLALIYTFPNDKLPPTPAATMNDNNNKRKHA